MRIVMAPARNVRPYSAVGFTPQPPLFLEDALQLVRILREYAPWQLETLLDLNAERALEMLFCYKEFEQKARAQDTPKKTRLLDTQQGTLPLKPLFTQAAYEDSPLSCNKKRNQAQHTKSRSDESCAALLAYYGAAFRSMNPLDFDAGDLAFAQRHLRILSALYGVLRPMDGILPHRLGMKKDFLVDGQDLYAFWGRRVYEKAIEDASTIINLCSQEYIKLIIPYLAPAHTLITCRFLVQKPGGARASIATIRAARGLMVRYIIKNKLTIAKDLMDFDEDGYRYVRSLSTTHNYVFVKG